MVSDVFVVGLHQKYLVLMRIEQSSFLMLSINVKKERTKKTPEKDSLNLHLLQLDSTQTTQLN